MTSQHPGKVAVASVFLLTALGLVLFLPQVLPILTAGGTQNDGPLEKVKIPFKHGNFRYLC